MKFYEFKNFIIIYCSNSIINIIFRNINIYLFILFIKKMEFTVKILRIHSKFNLIEIPLKL